MAGGSLDRVEAASRESQERQAAFAAQRKPQLWLKQGETAVVRFLEQGGEGPHRIRAFYVHEYKVMGTQGVRNRSFTCLNDKEDGTSCPGCTAGMKRKVRFAINCIQRNRPIYRKGADGKAIKVNDQFIIDGYADEVVIFEGPNTTAEVLRQKDGQYHGLMSLDVLISNTGAQFQRFQFDPADISAGFTALSEADTALFARKHNLDEFMAPPSFQDAANIVARNHTGAPAGASAGIPGPPSMSAQGPAVQQNPYLAGATVPAGVPANAFAAAHETSQAPAQAVQPIPQQVPQQQVTPPQPQPTPSPTPSPVPPAQPVPPVAPPAPPTPPAAPPAPSPAPSAPPAPAVPAPSPAQ